MIVDTDGESVDRGNPTVKHPDQLDRRAVMAKGTNSTNYITPSTNQTTLDAGKNGQFTIAQVGSFTTDTTLSLANPGAGNFGNNFVWFYQAPHNLPFTPGFIGYEENSSGIFTPLDYSNFAAPASNQASWYTFDMAVDDTYVYLNVNMTGYGIGLNLLPGFIFKWYLLYQTSS